MLSASDLRAQIQSDLTVETEIYLLYVGILTAKDGGYTSVVLNNATVTSVNGVNVTGSPITNNSVYYNVWQKLAIGTLQTIEMNKVIDYFTKLGYTINRKSTNMVNLYWQINW
jgi:hypothetical protein